MPEFMKSLKIPQVDTPPDPIDGYTIIYGTATGIGTSTIENPDNVTDISGFVVDFDYIDSVISLGIAPANLSISNVVLEITEVFDNIGSNITIGDDVNHSLLMESTNNDTTTLGSYSLNPNYMFSVDTEIFIYINGLGSIQGTGVCRVYFD